VTTLRSLTEAGRRAAAEMLARIRSGELARPDMAVLHPDALSRAFALTFSDPSPEDVSTRWHLGAWMVRTFGEVEDRMEVGAWSWLALHLFEVLCPVKEGARKLREDARYLLEAGDYRKAYRHLLAGPFLLMRAHRGDPEAVRGLLATSPDAPGEVYEQLAARKYTVTSRAVVQVATHLYFDHSTGKLKRGAGGSAAGSPRRFSEVLQQFDLTYDLQKISPERLVKILPKEFGRFLKP
jgi:hypothetical protein